MLGGAGTVLRFLQVYLFISSFCSNK